jgi:hypothetical protein
VRAAALAGIVALAFVGAPQSVNLVLLIGFDDPGVAGSQLSIGLAGAGGIGLALLQVRQWTVSMVFGGLLVTLAAEGMAAGRGAGARGARDARRGGRRPDDRGARLAAADGRARVGGGVAAGGADDHGGRSPGSRRTGRWPGWWCACWCWPAPW